MWSRREAMIIIFFNLIVAGVLLGGAIIETYYSQPLAPSIIAVIMSAIAIGIAAVVFDNMEET